MQTVVEQFNLSKWVGQEAARDKLMQAGYRGQGPYVAFLFFRMITSLTAMIGSLVYVFFVIEPRPADERQDRHLPARDLSRHAAAVPVPQEQDPRIASYRSYAPFRTRSTCC